MVEELFADSGLRTLAPAPAFFLPGEEAVEAKEVLWNAICEDAEQDPADVERKLYGNGGAATAAATDPETADPLKGPRFLRLIAELELSIREGLANYYPNEIEQSWRVKADFMDGFEAAAAAAFEFYAAAPTLRWEEPISRLALVTLP